MKRIAVIGTGVIGRAWGVVFVRAGYQVALFDEAAGAAANAAQRIAETLGELEQGQGSPDRSGELQVSASLEQAMAGAVYAQESVHEDPAVKAAVFKAMDAIAAEDTILASSCSSLLPSDFLRDVPGRHRCLVAHPFNPAYLVPLVELVPGSWTRSDVVDRCRALLADCGQIPVVVRREVEGYVGNRLQAAVVNEAMHLLGQGVMSAADLDATLRWGLGLRWALTGPFETMDLNADGGIAEYMEKFGFAYQSMGEKLGVAQPWQEQAIKDATEARRRRVPPEDLVSQRQHRDRRLMALRTLMNAMEKEKENE